MRTPIAFIRDAFAEFEHVVWPTKNETKRYLWVVTIFILVSAVFLFALSYIFGQAIFVSYDLINGSGTNVELTTPIVSDLQVDTGDATVEIVPTEEAKSEPEAQ